MTCLSWCAARLALIILALFVGACSDDADKPASANLGDYCGEGLNVRCAEGTSCQLISTFYSEPTYACTRSCQDDNDCRGRTSMGEPLVCGIVSSGEQRCVEECRDGHGFDCSEPLPTACEVLDETHCAACGCPKELRCEPGVGCLSKSEPGSPCTEDSDCRTRNCSAITRTCRVALGQPCTAQDCDRCLSNSDGFSFCARECRSSADCGPGVCYDPNNDRPPVCAPRCERYSDPACPGTCVYDASLSMELWCDVDGASVNEGSRPLGAVCAGESDCSSKACVAVNGCSQHAFDVCPRGYCTTACTQDADCGAKNHCVNVPCAGALTRDCGSICLPSCAAGCRDYGSCVSYPAASGGEAEVCDPRREPGKQCRDASDCRSGVCIESRCSE